MQDNNISNISRKNLCKVAVKLFFAISEKWELTEPQKCRLAGVKSDGVLYGWKHALENDTDIILSEDSLIRLSYITGIYKSIQQLFSDPKQWQEWINMPNKQFENKSALERMLSGKLTDLAEVRYYLEIQKM